MANWKLSVGDFCHVHVPAGDSERAGRFYASVFGWELSEYSGTPYVEIKTSEDGIRGVIGPGVFGERDITAWILVDDVDAALARVEQHGGKALHAHPEVPPDFGDFGLASDPDGLVFGLWKKPS
jgi:predicted enzyme related to lactoylglutathione lyase